MPVKKKAKDIADRYKLQMASDLPEIEFVTTGLGNAVDKVVGFPRKRITEIYGLQGVGKTTLTLMSIAGLTKQGQKTLFIDCENSFNKERAKKLGVDLTKLAVIEVSIFEDVSDVILNEISNFDAIIVDSVAAMVPRAEFEGESGDANIGLKARLMGQLMRKVNDPLVKSKCALVFINQLRESMDMFGPKFSTPGGMALKYAASLRIELKAYSKDRIEKTKLGEKSRVGHKVTAEITKSKVGAPFQSVVFEVLY